MKLLGAEFLRWTLHWDWSLDDVEDRAGLRGFANHIHAYGPAGLDACYHNFKSIYNLTYQVRSMQERIDGRACDLVHMIDTRSVNCKSAYVLIFACFQSQLSSNLNLLTDSVPITGTNFEGRASCKERSAETDSAAAGESGHWHRSVRGSHCLPASNCNLDLPKDHKHLCWDSSAWERPGDRIGKDRWGLDP